MRLSGSVKNNSVIQCALTMLISALFFAFIYDLSPDSIRTPSYKALTVCIVLTLVLLMKRPCDTGAFFVMLAGMFVKLTYVMYTPVWCRQHDVIDFGAGEGHAAYIEYILEHKALPDFDPRSVWAFFQPPLHHAISAAWMWLGIRSRLPLARVQKNVQILPLLYMCLLTYLVYLICRQLGMKKQGTVVALLITSFHPVYILMSGSINNDALSVVLTVAAIYAAMVWYEQPSTMRIVVLGALIGLAMAAKLSAVLMTPAVAGLMIYKISKDTGRFSDRARLGSFIAELAAFAVVVFPLGLWWPVRNAVMFGMSPGYIPEVGEHVSRWGIIPTILDVRTGSPFLYLRSNGFEYDEYNLILAGIKSSLFGEGDFAAMPGYITAAGWILAAAGVLVLIVCIAAMIRTCIDPGDRPDKGIRMFLLCIVIMFIGGYVAFAVSGKNTSAMDIRYSAAAVAVMSVFAGLMYDRVKELGKRTVQIAVMVISGAFAAASAVFYFLVGLG